MVVIVIVLVVIVIVLVVIGIGVERTEGGVSAVALVAAEEGVGCSKEAAVSLQWQRLTRMTMPLLIPRLN